MQKVTQYESFVIPKSLHPLKIQPMQVSLLTYQRRYNNNLKKAQMQSDQLLSPQRRYQMTFEIQKQETQKMIDAHILSRWKDQDRNKYTLQVPEQKQQISFQSDILKENAIYNPEKPNVDEIVAKETRKMLSPNYSPIKYIPRPKSALDNTRLHIGKKKMHELNAKQTKETSKLFEMTNYQQISTLRL